MKKAAKKLLKKEKEKKKLKNYKEFMCPLNSLCPDYKNDRWPASNKQGYKDLASKCPYAHNYNELKFRKEHKAKIKGLKNLKKMSKANLKDGAYKGRLADKYEHKLEGDLKAWNPGGSKLDGCYGCNLAHCHSCAYRANYRKRNDQQNIAALRKFQTMKNSSKVKAKMQK